MKVLKAFWSLQLLWLLLISALFVSLGALSGSGSDTLARAPAWMGMVLLLAAYPAGLGSADAVFQGAQASPARLGAFGAASLSATLVAFAFVNGAAPSLLTAGLRGGLPDAAAMTLGELARAMDGARPVRELPPATVDAWLGYNHLAFHYVRRLEGTLAVALLAWVGLLTGYWSRRLRPRPLRRMAQWGMGAFVVVTTYFAGENGYELIVLRAAGPVEFAGDLVLVVPATLVGALGLATFAATASGRDLPAG